MPELGRFARELRALIWKPSVKEEVRAELAHHLEQLEADYVAAGMTPDAARAAARAKFGEAARLEEACRTEAIGRDRDRRRREWFGDLRQDVRFALRQMRSNRRFTLAAVLTLAVGIGASTTIFGIANAVLLRPAPYADPGGLVFLNETTPVGQAFSVSEPNYLDWRARMRAFSEIAAFTGRGPTLLSDGPPERLTGVVASHTLFTVLGVPPLLGRTFVVEETRPGGDALVAVLGHGLWQRRFGGDRAVVGRTLDLDGTRHRVIGVMPASFRLFGADDVFLPLVFESEFPRGDRRLETIGRLAPGATLEQASADMRRIAAELGREFPESNEGWSATARPLVDILVNPRFRNQIVVLLVAVGLLLLMSCVNVTNLLIARAVARDRELAVRSALGAGRGRLTRQFLTESAVLTGVGAVLGVGLALAAWPILERIGGTAIPRLANLAPDWRVAAFALGACALTALVVGVVPAVRTTRRSRARFGGASESEYDVLRSGARLADGGRLRHTLVVASVALAMVLLVGAGLVGRSFVSLMRTDLGFQPEQVVTGQIILPTARDQYATGEGRVRFFDEVTTRLEGLADVRAAGAINIAPFTRGNTAQSFWPEGQPPQTEADYRLASWRAVTPGFFATFGIPLLRGRLFDGRDFYGAPGVVVINETMARAGWGDEDPVGRRVTTSNGQTRTIVGVVGSARILTVDSLPRPTMYWPHRQFSTAAMWIAVRTTGDPAAAMAAIEREVAAVDAAIPVARLQPMLRLVANATAEQRLTMVVFAIFATAALVLAAAGLFGVVSYGVAQRTKEIGVRLALGAEPGRVVRGVLGDGLRLAAVGLAIGGLAAYFVSGTLRAILYRTEPTDPLTFAGVGLVLLVIAAVASAIPARRAARLDPVTALRGE